MLLDFNQKSWKVVADFWLFSVGLSVAELLCPAGFIPRRWPSFPILQRSVAPPTHATPSPRKLLKHAGSFSTCAYSIAHWEEYGMKTRCCRCSVPTEDTHTEHGCTHWNSKVWLSHQKSYSQFNSEVCFYHANSDKTMLKLTHTNSNCTTYSLYYWLLSDCYKCTNNISYENCSLCSTQTTENSSNCSTPVCLFIATICAAVSRRTWWSSVQQYITVSLQVLRE